MPDYRLRWLVALLVSGLLINTVRAEEASTAETDKAGDATLAGPSTDSGFTFPPEVEALLNQAADPDAYTETERCLTARDIRNTEILDDRHIVFEISRKRFYLIQFPYPCPGMRRNASLVYETRVGQLCQLDQIRAFEPGPGIPNPPCTLPGFMPVEQEQVTLLRESLKARRKAELDAYKAEKKRKKAEKAEKAASEPVSG